MAIPEACGVWIEQRVQEELEAKEDTGASLREIGIELVKEYTRNHIAPIVDNIHGTTGLPAETIRRWWKDINKEASKLVKIDQPKSKPPETTTETTPEIIKDRKPQGGGKRDGAGRPKIKTEDEQGRPLATEAMQFAVVAISQLERIRPDEPKKNEAFDRVVKWIEQHK